MATPHKHAEVIKAWADGAKIQLRRGPIEQWVDLNNPIWDLDMQYRIKPEPKPDIVEFRRVELVDKCADDSYYITWYDDNPNVRYVFDGETRKLKAVRIL